MLKADMRVVMAVADGINGPVNCLSCALFLH